MKSRKTREKILDASIELFNQKKASNVSTVQISAAMNISPGNLYYYYANKEEVIRCIWEERMLVMLEKLIEKIQVVNSAEDLLDYAGTAIKEMVEYRFFYTEMNTLFRNDNELLKLFSETEKRIKESLMAAIDRMVSGNRLTNLTAEEKETYIELFDTVIQQSVSLYDLYKEDGLAMEECVNKAWEKISILLKPIYNGDFQLED